MNVNIYMKSDKQLAEFIFDLFRKAKSRAGHIIMMRTFRFNVQDKLNPKEQENIIDIANRLISSGYITYEDATRGIECLRLTEKGYEYIYSENPSLEGFDVEAKSFEFKSEEEKNVPCEITVEVVKGLETIYKQAIQGEDKYNDTSAIEAFNNWYGALLIFLHRNFPDNNADYRFIKEQNVSGNGYVKHNVYDTIKARASVLLDEVEHLHAKPAIDTATPYVHANVKNISKIQMNNKPIYKIFVSSTFKDLEEERIKVMTTIVNCGHLPIGMEQFPAAPITAWNYIKLLIDNADYYLLLLAGKYGSIHPDTGKSYTQMEYEYAVEKKIPVICLTYNDVDSLPINKCEKDTDVREKLEKFRETVSSSFLRKTWKNIDDLALQVKTSIEKAIELVPQVGWIRADSVTFNEKKPIDFDLNEYITITPVPNYFSEQQPVPKNVTLKEFIIAAGSTLKEFAQIYQIKSAVTSLGDMDYNDLDAFLEKLLYYKVIERGQINNEYEGMYKVWSFTQEGLDLYLELKMKSSM